MQRPTIVLADDHKIVIEGLKKLLEPHFEIVGVAADGRELLSVAAREKPDVVLLDISLPVLNGIEVALRLRKQLPDTKLVFLTMHTDTTYLEDALHAGASGYVLKRCASGELQEAIRQALLGHTYITPELCPLITPKSGKTPAELTAREREVLQLVAEGKSAKEIASVLRISSKTVAFHKTNIMKRLGLRTTAELTRFCVRHGIVEN